MSNNPQIKYYPVSNGDMSLITLSDKTTILIDCHIRKSSIDSDDKKIFDVRKDLLSSIKRRKKQTSKEIIEIPYIDVFILTHGDKDHCGGYKNNFYQGHPDKYTKKDADNKLIMVDTMWFSPMIAEQYTNKNEQAYQKEAERRLKLHRKNDSTKDDPGNRIKIIGYDGNEKYDDLNHLRAVPGTTVSRFNDVNQKFFSIFIHAPFKIKLDSPDKDKNSASIVLQARFLKSENDTAFSCSAIFGGDSDHTTWNQILDKSKRHKNELALNWDLFLAPHHCSWGFFNNTPQAENPEPKETSLEILNYAQEGAYVIASSKKIINNDDNPPHYKAKKEYLKKLSSKDNFLNTATEPKDGEPEPIIFNITPNGPSKALKGNISGSKTSAGGIGAAATIITHG